MSQAQVYILDELTSGIRTRPRLDGETIPHLLVESLDWDSGLRGSGLQPGDRIVSVDGEGFAGLGAEDIAKRQRTWIGQYSESEGWKTQQRKDGDTVQLQVRRRQQPRGWMPLDIHGRLKAKRSYRDAGNSPTLWPGGPNNYERSGFNDAWPAWVEAMQKRFVWILCEGWQQTSLVSRYELKGLLEEQARVDYLVQHFPGAFATAFKADYDAAVASARGAAYPIGAAELAFRRADEERAAEAGALGREAWHRCISTLDGGLAPAFPAPHPVFGKAAERVGHHVLLEKLPQQNWISEAGHNWLIAGSQGDGWYFIDAESDAAFRMFRAMRRYQKLVSPDLRQEFTLVARVQKGAAMLAMGQAAHWGLPAEPVAALIGDAMFVDLRQTDGSESRFAGEDGLLKPRIDMPPADAAPETVLTAMVTAIKAADLTVWKALFADWRLSRWFDGSPQLHYLSNELRDGAWEDSRRTLLSRACDARVVWVDEPQLLMRGDEFPGAPKLEEVQLELEHIGAVDGTPTTEYRAFKDVTVNRLWRLQRIDNGPWRIASAQNL